ncbi:hypothetical protein NBRC111894_1781 [Sporolactobacillus inulinus]|uniref:Uncharacterized protein n=1 Tax=Sporolactobacillus inulinus TaxID=2078 RepID=A0A4Y1ZAY9_9BACL|nr:hypothetical protein NBRC111894_1781 [Sporolactobacillus inulinus]
MNIAHYLDFRDKFLKIVVDDLLENQKKTKKNGNLFREFDQKFNVQLREKILDLLAG